MIRTYSISLILLALAAAVLAEVPAPYNSEKSATAPMPAEEAAAQWKLPPGFKASVFASEPDVRQPIAMAMDGRGRLWVAECYTYAENKIGFDDTLRDRIVIFEDTDNDGKHDKRTVFVEGLTHLSSIEIGFGGVWALTSPTLVFIPDTNHDDRPDGPAEVQLDGFEWQQNHHTMANGLRWGPDGWLYGRHGIQAVSNLGRPGTPSEKRANTNGGIWRYHPQSHRVEIVCEGTTNPWGMDWNEFGEAFFINTVIGHLWHVIPGAHYRRMHGSDLNPNIYEVIEQHADHVHWAAGEEWNDWNKLGTTDATSAAGGGHAHTGLMFYGGENWPSEWRSKLLTINFNGRRLNVEDVVRTPSGSGYTGHRAPDIGFSADPWFRGIDLIYGPDGGVFIADWSDTGECHEHDGVHRLSGRIYKISYDQPALPLVKDIAALAPMELLPLLRHPNEFLARHARQRLQELAVSGEDLSSLRSSLLTQLEQPSETIPRLRSLWALQAIGGMTKERLRDELDHSNEHVRTWAIRLLTDDKALLVQQPEIASWLTDRAVSEASPMVRLALASALQKLPLAQRSALAAPLFKYKEDAADHNIPQMLWYGVEPLGNSDPAALAALGILCEMPLTRRCIAIRLTDQEEHQPLDQLLRHAATQPAWQADVLTGMCEALNGEREAKPPQSWAKVSPVFAKSTDPAVQDSFRALGTLFGDPAALESSRKMVLENTSKVELRRSILRSLIDRRLTGLKELCLSVLTVPGLSATAVDGLTLNSDPAVADLILAQFSSIAANEHSAVLSSLISRPAWAIKVLEAIAASRLARSDLTVFHTRQMRNFKLSSLDKKLEEVWGTVRDADASKQKKIQNWKYYLSPAVLAATDLTKGKALFASVCAVCHKLNDVGGQIGPELTGSGRDNLDYLLQNIVDPSAAVAREYQLVTLQMKDGRSLGGFIRSRNERSVVLQTLTESVSLPTSDIATTDLSPVSLMPEGLLDALTPEETRDLIAYLMKK